jgi:hypothetical protein
MPFWLERQRNGRRTDPFSTRPEPDRKSVHAFAHVGVAEREMHFHACWNEHHGAILPLPICARTAPGSLPAGANTRRPLARSVAIIHFRGRTRSRRACAAAVSSESTIWANLARFSRPTPSSARQRNNSPVTIPCLRATADILASGRVVSCTMASFASSLKKGRMGWRAPPYRRFPPLPRYFRELSFWR